MTERFSLEKRMNAFMGRFGVPSGLASGVAYCRLGTSGVGLTDGVKSVTVSSLAEGEEERSAEAFDCAVDLERAERRIARSGRLASLIRPAGSRQSVWTASFSLLSQALGRLAKPAERAQQLDFPALGDYLPRKRGYSFRSFWGVTFVYK